MCQYDHRDTCYTRECHNGGGCVMTGGRPQCHCPDGFTGSSCEVRATQVCISWFGGSGPGGRGAWVSTQNRDKNGIVSMHARFNCMIKL